MDAVGVIHYRLYIWNTEAACGGATPDDEWATDPDLVTCLTCILSPGLSGRPVTEETGGL